MPKIEIDDTTIKVFFERFPKGLRQSLLKVATKVGAGLERFVKTDKLSGQLLKVRTGTLRRSIFHKVTEHAKDIEVTVGADLEKAKYARVQELGGVIRPTKSRYLTIPLDAVKTKNGVARFRARDVIGNPGSFGYTGTFVRNKVIFGKRPSGEVVPLFALKESVTLKAVGYLSGSVEEKEDWIIDQYAEAIAEAISEDIKRG